MPRPTHPYVATAEGWLYLAAVMDLASRRIVGWSMRSRIDAKIVCDAAEHGLLATQTVGWD